MNDLLDPLLESVLGTYIRKDIDPKTGFGNEYILKLKKAQNNRINFELEMTTVGEFGRIGETWYGRGVSRGDHIALIIEKQVSWVESAKERQKVENPQDMLKTLPVELYPHFDKVVIYHKKLEKYIILEPATEQQEQISE